MRAREIVRNLVDGYDLTDPTSCPQDDCVRCTICGADVCCGSAGETEHVRHHDDCPFEQAKRWVRKHQ